MDDPIFDSYAPMIEHWDKVTRVSPNVFPGCQLYKDVFAGTPELAWTALVVSVDNLAALLKLYDHESSEFHESATFSIARAPILAASTAYWLLAPDKYQRRVSRGLSLLEENLKNIERFSAPLRDEGESATLELQRHIDDERNRIATCWETIGRPAVEKPDDTWIVDSVARDLEKLKRCDHRQVLGLWRLCSGHAHAMRWALEMPNPEDPYTAMNDLMGVGMSITLAAFELWESRTNVAT